MRYLSISLNSMVHSCEHLHRKRPREESLNEHERQPSAKRRKADTVAYSRQFWDTLSTVTLTRRALVEFDRRVIASTIHSTRVEVKPAAKGRLLRSDTRRLRAFASRGGPDLSILRGYSDQSIAGPSMSQSSTQSRSRKRDHASSTSKSSLTGKTKSTMPYSAEFEQKLIDRGVYPDGYRTKDGAKPPKPANMKEMREALVHARSSLSPSKMSEEIFEDFQDNNRRAKSEITAMADVIPMITGEKDRQFETKGDIPFTNLQKFDTELSVPKPDRYYGARPDQIDERVRHDLDEYIIPSKSKHRPAAANFFLEGKGAAGRPDVAQRQAMYDGAVGARAMLHLQNYSRSLLEYDGNAYALSTTYCDGQLKVYATHPTLSESKQTEYHMTQLDTYGMTGNLNSFRSGANAFRNARDWTRRQRDRLITDANVTARNAPAQAQSASQTESTLEVSSTPGTASFSSDTSVDELALDHGTATKRRRPVAPN